MSCQTRAKQVGQQVGRAAGLPQTLSQSAYALGSGLLAQTQALKNKENKLKYQMAGKVAPYSKPLLQNLNRFERLGLSVWGRELISRAGLAATTSLLSKQSELSPQQARQAAARLAASAGGTLGKVSEVSQTLGSFIGDQSRTKLATSVVQDRRQFIFKQKQAIQVWNSKLTPWLNRRDQWLPQAKIQSSKGVLIKVDGQSWHSGVTKAQTPNGSKTMTHIQSLSLPQQHYYFERALPMREAAALVSGQRRAEQIQGYVGQISPAESLVPNWARLKGGLIKSQIYFPPESKAEPESRQSYQPRLPSLKRVEYLYKKSGKLSGVYQKLRAQVQEDG